MKKYLSIITAILFSMVGVAWGEEIKNDKSDMPKTIHPSIEKAIDSIIKDTLKEREAMEWFNKGYEANEAKNYDRAISMYKKAIAINPDNPGFHNNIGSAYDCKGMLDEAIAEYKKAIAILSRW
jgi:tetratricopeptide (TPR) repeat protein